MRRDIEGVLKPIDRTESKIRKETLALMPEAFLKWYYDQNITSFFPSDFKRVFVSHLTGKILRFKFYPQAVFFSASLGFHGPPLFTVKTDRLDLRGLDRG